MTRRKSRKPEKLDNNDIKISTSQVLLVNSLSFPLETGKTFLGYKLKNTNQLWRWDTLEDVNFDNWKKQ